jgi:hypothetical protein
MYESIQALVFQRTSGILKTPYVIPGPHALLLMAEMNTRGHGSRKLIEFKISIEKIALGSITYYASLRAWRISIYVSQALKRLQSGLEGWTRRISGRETHCRAPVRLRAGFILSDRLFRRDRRICSLH